MVATKKFIKANDKSPVVEGSAIGRGGEGGRYTLKDGTHFRLPVEVCRELPEGYPKWDI